MGIVAGVLGLTLLVALLVVPPLVAGLKGRRDLTIVGIFIGQLWSWIGAFQTAEPNSWWARRYYDDEKLKLATEKSDERRQPDPRLAPGGGGYGLDPTSPDSAPKGSVQCRLCGSVFLSDEGAVAHAGDYHTEVTFEDAKAALVPIVQAEAAGRT